MLGIYKDEFRQRRNVRRILNSILEMLKEEEK